MRRKTEGTGFVQWASLIGATLLAMSLLMLAVSFYQLRVIDPGIVSSRMPLFFFSQPCHLFRLLSSHTSCDAAQLYSRMVYAGYDQVVLMRSANSLVAPRVRALPCTTPAQRRFSSPSL